MSKYKILCVADGGITRDIFSSMKKLEQEFDGVEVQIVDDADIDCMGKMTDRLGVVEKGGVDAAPDCQNLLDNCGDADIIAVHIASINKHVLDRCRHLKVAAVLRGGYENADADELAKRGIPLINAPWRSAEAVADFTVGMMIAANKNIALAHHQLFSGSWCKTYPNEGHIHNMNRMTAGLIGYGYIGSRVAKRLEAFGTKVIAYDPFVDAETLRSRGADPVSLDELLGRSDFISVHLRQSEKTHHFMDAEKFAKMKPTAYFINTARPLIVDTDALVDALQKRTICGAAVDVFDEEPLAPDHPYLKLDNITLTPHLAGTSCDTMACSVDIGIEEFERYLRGEPMLNVRNGVK